MEIENDREQRERKRREPENRMTRGMSFLLSHCTGSSARGQQTDSRSCETQTKRRRPQRGGGSAAAAAAAAAAVVVGGAAAARR